jgi:hypothetical protein
MEGEILESWVTWFRWPQDRPVVLETPSVKPRVPGETDTVWVPTFDMHWLKEAAGRTDDSPPSMWLEIRSALRAAASNSDSSDYNYCAVIEIEGLRGEFGICTCARPLRPLVNSWKHRDQHTARKIADRRGLARSARMFGDKYAAPFRWVS